MTVATAPTLTDAARGRQLVSWISIVALALLSGLLLPFGASLTGLLIGGAVAVLFLARPRLSFVLFGLFVCVQQLTAANLRLVSAGAAGLLGNADEATIALMAILVGATALLRGRTAVSPRAYLLLASVAGIGLLSAALHRVPLSVQLLDLFLMFKVPLLFLVAAHIRFEERDVLHWWKAFAVWAVITVVVAFVDVLTYPLLRNALHNTAFVDFRFGMVAANAFFVHPGALGFFLASMVLVNTGLFATTRRREFAWTALISAVGILLSLRLKPLIGVPAVMIAVGFFAGMIPRRTVLMIVLPSLLFLAALAPAVVKLGRAKLSLSNQADESAPRALLYLTGYEVARDNFPLGAGLGRFGGEASLRYYSPVYVQYGLSHLRGFRADSGPDTASYLHDAGWAYYLGELGVAGMILVVTAFGVVVRVMLRIGRHASSPVVRGFGLGAAMVMLESMLEAVASPMYQSSMQGYFALGIAGIAYAAWRTERLNSRQGLPAHG